MKKGKVKWYNEVKGFGFIETEENKDIFVHKTGLVKPNEGLKEGDLVEFETKAGEKGPMAVDVKKA